MSYSSADNPTNVTVLICGPDGLCSLCAGEDRTGTDGCGSYFHVPAERRVATSEPNPTAEPF